jgi:hypothetical protein
MRIQTFRDDALAEMAANGLLKIRGVLVSEFLTIGRIGPLGTKTEVDFRPGVIYKIYTGIAIDGVDSPFKINVRVSDEIFKYGANALRVEIGARNELIVYLTTLETFKFMKQSFIFEASVASDGSILGALETASVTIEPSKSIPPPGQVYKESITLRDAPRPPEAEKAATADAAQRVQAWLNEPDTKGRIVGEDKPTVHEPDPKTSGKTANALTESNVTLK